MLSVLYQKSRLDIAHLKSQILFFPKNKIRVICSAHCPLPIKHGKLKRTKKFKKRDSDSIEKIPKQVLSSDYSDSHNTTTTPREASSLWPKELGFRRTHTVEWISPTFHFSRNAKTLGVKTICRHRRRWFRRRLCMSSENTQIRPGVDYKKKSLACVWK